MVIKKPRTSFSRSEKLTTASQYRRAFRNAVRLSTASFTCLVRTTDKNYARLGIIVSKREVRRAVDRNRIKRIIRESFRLHKAELPIVDIVVMCKKSALDMANAEIFKQLQILWARIE